MRASGRRWAALCVVGIVGIGPLGAGEPIRQTAPLSPALVSAIADMKSYLSQTTGRRFSRDVPMEMMSAEQVKAYLSRRLHEDYPGTAIADEQTAMVHLGLLAPGDDLEALFIGMLSDQAAGFYDPEEQRLFLVKGKPFAGIALVHELAHALQDQSFTVKRMMDSARADDDRLLAFQALIEGEAMALSARYAAARPSMAGELAGLDAGDEAPEDLSKAMASLEKLPAILRESMLFPYTTGMIWAGAIEEKGGSAAMDRQFRTPPDSSEQILHPEKAEAPRDTPAKFATTLLPDLSGSGWRAVKSNTMGEFALRQLFGGSSGAAEAASGWDGDRYAVYRRQEGPTAMVWVSAWDTLEDAAQFEARVTSWLKARHPSAPDADAGWSAGRGPTDRRVVWIAEGFDASTRGDIAHRLGREIPAGVTLQ